MINLSSKTKEEYTNSVNSNTDLINFFNLLHKIDKRLKNSANDEVNNIKESSKN